MSVKTGRGGTVLPWDKAWRAPLMIGERTSGTLKDSGNSTVFNGMEVTTISSQPDSTPLGYGTGVEIANHIDSQPVVMH